MFNPVPEITVDKFETFADRYFELISLIPEDQRDAQSRYSALTGACLIAEGLSKDQIDDLMNNNKQCLINYVIEYSSLLCDFGLEDCGE